MSKPTDSSGKAPMGGPPRQQGIDAGSPGGPVGPSLHDATASTSSSASKASAIRGRMLEVVHWKRVVEAALVWREKARSYQGIDHEESDLVAAVDALLAFRSSESSRVEPESK